MSNLIISGVTFSGLPDGTGNQSGWMPTRYVPKQKKIGVTLPAANGTRNRVERGTIKRTWEIGWEETNTATMQTLRTISAILTTFSFVDLEGNTYTVQTEDDEFAPEFSFTSGSGANYWNVTLTLYEH